MTDVTTPMQSTFAICSKHPFKVKAKLNSKSIWFPPTRLLLGSYDYRFKHLADRDVMTTLQVDCLAQFFGIEELESRTTPFQGGEDDTTMPASSTTSLASTPTTAPAGPITHSRAKKIQEEVHALLCEFQLNINENFILPKLCVLTLLRFTQKDDKDTSSINQREGSSLNQSSVTEASRRNSHIF